MTGAPAALLAQAPLFADLSDQDRADLAAVMMARSYRDGDMLMVQNSAADGLFLIAAGEVEIGKRLPGGGIARLAMAGPGETVGEMALIGRDSRRSASAFARSTVHGWFLSLEQFRAALLRLHPASLALQRGFAQLVATRVIRKTADIAALLTRYPDQFIARPRRNLRAIIEPAFDAEPFLAKLPACAAMSAGDRRRLWDAGTRIDAPSDTDLAMPGQPTERMWLVIRGAVRSALPHGDGIYQLTVSGPGQMIGLAPWLAAAPQDRLLRTSEQATLLQFDGADFARLLLGQDALARELAAALSADLVTALDGLDQAVGRILALQRGHAVAA